MRTPLTLLLVLAAIACGGSAPEPVAPSPPDPPAPAPVAAPPAPTATTPSAPPPEPAPVATHEDPPSKPVDDAKPPPPPDPLEGTIGARKGREVTVKIKGAPPEPGAKASLEKFFEGKAGDPSPLGALGGLFGGGIQGWIGIAAVTVKKVDKDVVTLTIDEEKSKMKVNGKPVDHFKSGAKVRLSTP